MLFILACFPAFHLVVTAHPTCVFPSLVVDMHIIGPALDVVLFFYDYSKSFSPWFLM
jgi:hypothetical protein